MSDLLIRGMELPENCFKCPAHEWYDFGGKNHGYQCPILRTTKAISNCEARTKRRDNCPLIPVLPHGRLIDADAVAKMVLGSVNQQDAQGFMFTKIICQILKDAPTIIPAEEGET